MKESQHEISVMLLDQLRFWHRNEMWWNNYSKTLGSVFV